MLEVKNDALVFNHPKVHPEARCTVIFQRTLRLPGDSGRYPVPPGLGRYRLAGVSDCHGAVPRDWSSEDVFFPMFQSEALWIIFVGWYPFAVKVAAGDVNAITGRRLHDERLWRPRDYTVVPRRPWMEWFCVGSGRGRQFVAMPFGKGGGGGCQTVTGSIHITAHPMRAERYGEYRRSRAAIMRSVASFCGDGAEGALGGGWSGGFHADGDQYGPGAWELSVGSSCDVHPVNSLTYMSVTGDLPPGHPPGAVEYSEAGLPWYDQYGADSDVLEWSRPRVS